MADEATLQFRATVAFLLEGVPHHAAGAWYPSKKMAQRDAAERSLHFFVGQWGKELLGKQWPNMPCSAESEVQVLEAYCLTSADLCGGAPPKFTVTCLEDSGLFEAHVEMQLISVPHKFKGAPAASEQAARADAARRVLWYLQCPGFEQLFDLDPNDPAVLSLKIPPPSDTWSSCDSLAADAVEVAEKKTAVMRVQNRLQQTFSRNLRSGQSVWEWCYETDGKDDQWPPLYRASVQIPVVDRTFTGDWARGQREAQISAITHVTSFLDACQASDANIRNE